MLIILKMVTRRIKAAVTAAAYKAAEKQVYKTHKKIINRPNPSLRGQSDRRLRNVTTRIPYDIIPKVGHTTGRGNCKRHVATDTVVQLDDRTLNFVELTDIPKAVSTELSDRQRNIINISGVKIDLELKSEVNNNLVFNYAVITPLGRTTNVSTVGFLRANLSNTSRALDFGNGNNSIDHNYGMINSDKYAVLMHKRVTVGARFSNNTNNSQVSQTSSNVVREWLPINRQFRFDDQTSSTCDTPLYFVWWADQICIGAGSTPTLNAYRMGRKVVVYFREPKD